MPKNLVIVESPAKASTIKSYLGSSYKVMASKGHVRDLPKSTLGVDIENNFTPKYINIRGKAPLINDLKKEAKNADKIFLATDPDREGEAISWHLATALNIPVDETKRVTFNEITKTAIKSAIKQARNIDMDLVNSQQARRILDRIVGYKLSPFLWQNVKNGLSAGRVQSVATRIIVEREEEIRAFIPREYWTIDTLLETSEGKSFTASFFGNAKTKKKAELKTESESIKIVDKVKNLPFTVLSVKKSVKQKNPAPPFITSTLQQEASYKLGFQSQRTMRVAQELYEGVNIGSENGGVQGLITYMRTDSTRVSSEAVSAAKAIITDKYGADYYPAKPRVFKSKSTSQDAHEAIRPANVALEPDMIKSFLSSDQYKLYKLIWNRFIACQMASALLDTVSADIVSDDYLFRASGYTIKFQGYMAVYEEYSDPKKDKAEDTLLKSKLPDIKEGDILKLLKITPLQHFTEPPPRFTEASLVKFLEEKGIGRPSTYSPIITTIITRGYIVRENKVLKPTQLGELTTKLMIEYFPDIVDYKFTAHMEDELDNIENGELTITDVLNEFYNKFESRLNEANQSVSKSDIVIPVEETDIICDKCGSKMIIKHGRYGKFAACPNYPECKNTKPLVSDNQSEDTNVEKTDMKCDLCGKDMVIRRGRYGSFYACSDYPNCKNTKPIAKAIDVPCPLCGSKILSKQSKKKTIYYSCEKYPDCQFSSWDMPTNEKCPKCGKMLYRKKGKPQLICHDKDCGYKVDVQMDEENGTN